MSKLLKGAGILAICALIAKMIGAMYRIPLTNIIGAEGMGLYQMVFPLYTVLLTVSSGGLPVAISKVVSEKRAKGDEAGARQVLKVTLASLAVAGAVCAAVIVIFREKIAFVQGNESAALPYLGIAPSLVFVAVIASLRGYFQGVHNMFPSAFSQIVEQGVKLVAGLYFARLFISVSPDFGALGALIGVSLSEFAAMSILIIQFFLYDRRFKKRSMVDVNNLNFEAGAELAGFAPFRPKTKSELLKEVYRIAIPVTLGSLVMPLTQVIDSILVINLLVSGGVDRSVATSLFGLVTGPVNSLINMPVVITLSLSIALLPKVSECFSGGGDACGLVAKGLKYSVLVGVFAALALGVFARPIFNILYSKGLTAEQISTGASLLALGCVSVLYVSILQIATTVLQGVGMAHKPALNLMYGAILKVVLTLFLLPLFGIKGAFAATVMCYGLTCFLDVKAMLKYVRPKLSAREIFVAPLLGGGAFVLVGIMFIKLLSPVLAPIAALIIAGALASAVFVTVLVLCKAVSLDELESVPAVEKMLKKLKQKREIRKAKRKERKEKKQ